MTENVQLTDPKYAEVAEEYEEDVLVVGVPEAFANFSMSGSYPRQALVHPRTFQQLYIGSAMTENVLEADPEYAEVAKEYEDDVLIVSVPEAFPSFLKSSSYPRQARVYNPYFSAIIMFVCALSFEEKDLHHLM